MPNLSEPDPDKNRARAVWAEQPSQVLLKASQVYSQSAQTANSAVDRFMFDEACWHYRQAAYRLYPLRVQDLSAYQQEIDPLPASDRSRDRGHQVILDTELHIQTTLDAALAALTGAAPLVPLLAALYEVSCEWRDDVAAGLGPQNTVLER